MMTFRKLPPRPDAEAIRRHLLGLDIQASGEPEPSSASNRITAHPDEPTQPRRTTSPASQSSD